jgi:hypothetical protein
MAHFAKINENNQVVMVTVVDNINIIDSSGNESEQLGNAFLNSIAGLEGRWVQSSYNGNFRGVHASIGDIYDETNDVFIPNMEWRENPTELQQ